MSRRVLEIGRWEVRALFMKRNGLLPANVDIFNDLAVAHDDGCPLLDGRGPCGGPCRPDVRLKDHPIEFPGGT